MRSNKAGGILTALTAFSGILVILLWVFAVVTSLYGLFLAFSASIVLGIIVLFVQPAPFVFGVIMFLFDKNLPEEIMRWLNG